MAFTTELRIKCLSAGLDEDLVAYLEGMDFEEDDVEEYLAALLEGFPELKEAILSWSRDRCNISDVKRVPPLDLKDHVASDLRPQQKVVSKDVLSEESLDFEPRVELSSPLSDLQESAAPGYVVCQAARRAKSAARPRPGSQPRQARSTGFDTWVQEQVTRVAELRATYAAEQIKGCGAEAEASDREHEEVPSTAQGWRARRALQRRQQQRRLDAFEASDEESYQDYDYDARADVAVKGRHRNPCKYDYHKPTRFQGGKLAANLWS